MCRRRSNKVLGTIYTGEEEKEEKKEEKKKKKKKKQKKIRI